MARIRIEKWRNGYRICQVFVGRKTTLEYYNTFEDAFHEVFISREFWRRYNNFRRKWARIIDDMVNDEIVRVV